jgi:phage N-6-adenine-methyltransferase
MSRRAYHASTKRDWETPAWLFEWARKTFGPFDLDACATLKTTKALAYFESDGLNRQWSGKVWMNPPYGRALTVTWVRKAVEESESGRAIVVGLIPARVDQPWFQDLCARRPIWFIRGRVQFVGAQYNAPFPSCVVLFARHPERAMEYE